MKKRKSVLCLVCALLFFLSACRPADLLTSEPGESSEGMSHSSTDGTESEQSGGASGDPSSEEVSSGEDASSEDSSADESSEANSSEDASSEEPSQSASSSQSGVSSQASSKPNTPSSSKPSTSTAPSSKPSSSSKPASSAAPTPTPTPTPDPTPSEPGFSWDAGGNYTGAISVRENGVSGTQFEKRGGIIDYGNASQGYVMVKRTFAEKCMARVTGPSGVQYTYPIPNANTYYALPLQMGNGSYTIDVLQNVQGSSYVKAASTTVSVSLSQGSINYLYPNIYANYNSNFSAVRKGFGLCMNAKNDLDKVKSVYNYIIRNISYNYALAANPPSNYVPNPDATLSSGTGICFDYACLMATMLRSQGVPTKIVFGYAGGVYHAWNEVYIQNKGWITVGIPSNGGWKRLDSTFGVSSSDSYLENNANYTSTQYF